MILKDIAAYLGGELFGPEDIEISGPAKIESAKEGELTFLSNIKYKHHLTTTGASVVIVDQKYEEITTPYILVKNAYVAFVMVLRAFEPKMHTAISGVSEFSFIDDNAIVDPTANIAAGAYIGPDVKVGQNSIVYPGVVVLQGSSVGDDCVLYPNVSIRENCQVGDRVILQNGCVIGSDGFGFAPHEGKYQKIPQIGNVVIEDDVEIGANTTIDRATVGETRIKQGTKIDNLVQLAHNVVVGEHTVIVSQAGIAGSTEIGNHVTIGGQAAAVGHIKIGDHAILAARSGISKDVPEKAILWGSPAVPIMQQKPVRPSLMILL